MTLLIFALGLAIFLLAMQQLEQGIRETSGDGLKRWIVNRTDTAISSAFSGVVVTAILQSSSMVSLIVLAFVSAGIMPLYNGIGVMLGANLGTTFTGWVVTVIGFKMDLQALVIPLLGLGAMLTYGYVKNPKLIGVGRALFAFGLLIFGLDVMKESVAGLSDVLDFASLKGMPMVVYFIAGTLLAAAMQSSSAVMIITLSLLNTQMLELNAAAALVIGADLGTTSTTILGSLGESAVKKQLAFAQVIFNLTTNALAFAIMLPLLPAALEFLAIEDELFGLVTFHSSFNLAGLLIFLPLMRFYTRWVERVLPAPAENHERIFMVPVNVPEVAIDSLASAVDKLANEAIHLYESEFDLSLTDSGAEQQNSPPKGSFTSRYEGIKSFENRIINFANRVQVENLDEKQRAKIATLISATRYFVYACKTLKDVRHDFHKLEGERETADTLFETHHAFLQTVFTRAHRLCNGKHTATMVIELMDELTESNGKHFEEANTIVTNILINEQSVAVSASTWFNLNHEIHHAVRYLLSAVVERNFALR